MSDRDLAKQVTRKLLTNAKNANATRVDVSYLEYIDQGFVEVVFADDGDGMTPAELEALGFRADPNRMRGGKGVPQIMDLIRRARGTVRWDSRKTVGTWVTIHLKTVIGAPTT